MAKGLKRYYGFGHLHFITFSCYQRRPLLGSVRARTVFLKVLDEVRARYHFALVGYVVMPDHVHLLISEPRKGTPSTVLQVLKQGVSRRLRRRKRAPCGQLRLRFPATSNALPRFWQRRFYDFNVWSERKKTEKLDYMHDNPSGACVRGGMALTWRVCARWPGVGAAAKGVSQPRTGDVPARPYACATAQ